MTPQEFRNALSQTLVDHQLSRAERQALKAVIKEVQPAETQLDLYRQEVFDLARESMVEAVHPEGVMDWVEEVVRLLNPSVEAGKPVSSEAYFSPGEDCRNRIRSLFRQARGSVDVCVFTITDDDISDVIAETHHRGVEIRIITDDDKAEDIGSDVARLAEIGVPVRYDNTPFHMHHKFAIFDESILLSGSYNWTRSAARNNEENIVVQNDLHLVRTFSKVFNSLWDQFA